MSARATAVVCMLRGINVGARNRVAMAALGEVFETLGFEGAKTVLNTGNVVFRAGRTDRVKKTIEDAIENRTGVRPDAILRTAAELRRVVEANPFSDAATGDPAHLVIVFLDRKPAPDAARALEQWDRGPERIRAIGKDCYVHYVAGIGRSKLTPSILESTSGVRGTGRNWNTVQKLVAALDAQR